MEAVMMHGSLDQSISPYKSSYLKNSKKFHQNPIISYPSDALWLSHFNSIGLLQPPPPPFLSQSYPLPQSSQPPLLPLPASARGLSCSPANKKSSFLTSKKSKSPKKEGRNSPKKSKDVAKVIGGGLSAVVVGDQVDMFSGSAVFTISPPPSSLPLPTFSLRPKLSCKAEAAAGVDAGATDDLRRLLRLL